MALEGKARSYCWPWGWDEGMNAAMERHRYLGEKWELCHPVDISPTGCCSFSLCNWWLVAFPRSTRRPCSLPHWHSAPKRPSACDCEGEDWPVCTAAFQQQQLCRSACSLSRPHLSSSLFLSLEIPMPPSPFLLTAINLLSLSMGLFLFYVVWSFLFYLF